MSESTPPDSLPAWSALNRHATIIERLHMREMFESDPDRFNRFSVRLDDLLLDYSKQRITGETLGLLIALAREAGVEALRDRMFAGEPINSTEHRAVLHMALRDRSGRAYAVDGRDVRPEVEATLGKMRDFCRALDSGARTGATGQRITDIVNIGIGGSDLGPAMVAEALTPFHRPGLKSHFVANVDGAAIAHVLAACRPETTLFVIVSKTFTTLETLTNARTARDWLVASLGEAESGRHLVAVSSNQKGVTEFGIHTDDRFDMWDWVGGRYSLWSSVGLTAAAAIGFENFEALLAGAADMDEHFLTAPIEANLPVILGLVGIWNRNFLGSATHAVLPYDQNLARLPDHLQQVEMESNGKSVARDGSALRWETAPVIFGEAGTCGQHSFHQLIHQGTSPVPADFLVAARSLTPMGEHHAMLMANCFAQSEALMRGKNEDEVRAELSGRGMAGAELEEAIPHRVFTGNRPSSTLLYSQLTPRTLGRLVALYEHKVFVQGAIWNIDSFDQWGVELGKQLALPILDELTGKKAAGHHDSSTRALIAEAHKRAGTP